MLNLHKYYVTSPLFRFVIVGTFNTSISYCIYAVMLFMNQSYAIANLIALVSGIVIGFKTQGLIVFRNRDNLLIFRFILLWSIIYTLTIVFIGNLIKIGLTAYTSGVLALPFSTILSFFGQKYFVFRTKT